VQCLGRHHARIAQTHHLRYRLAPETGRLAIITAALSMSSAYFGPSPAHQRTARKTALNIRPLGNSDINMTVVGLGTNYVGGHNLYADVDEEEGVRLVQRAVDLGITSIDTADVYGLGRSEELVGKALAGRRDQVVLATKGGNMFSDGRSGPNNDPKYLREALLASLKRLNVEYVDLYYIHRPDGETAPEDAYGELMRFKEEGLIRAGGLSNFDLQGIKAAQQAGPVAALQSQFNLLQRALEGDVLPYCADNDIAFIPWGPLAYGLLGGRYTRDFVLPKNDWRHRSGLFGADTYASSLDVVDGLKQLGERWDIPIAHLAVQWLASRPGVCSVITGAKTCEQVEDNARAASVSLTADQIEQITALVA
jgi:aryl-alcohol dehydrogenase-like predicted oxidoreductase